MEQIRDKTTAKVYNINAHSLWIIRLQSLLKIIVEENTNTDMQ